MTSRTIVVVLLTAAVAAEPAVPLPEPMVFDLVRPLGARSGELEVNTLAQRTHRSGVPWSWAPEIEYAFADGYSAELEFPFEGSSLRQYKAAFQGTFATAAAERYVHGWQTIGRWARHENSWSGDLLYLAGYRINRSWSVFNMHGLRRAKQPEAAHWTGISTPSVFRTFSGRWTVGLESNFVFGPATVRQHLVMPQVQGHFSHE